MKKLVSELKKHKGVLNVTCLDVHYQGALITHLSLLVDETITYWSGHPITGKHSEEILIDKKTKQSINEKVTFLCELRNLLNKYDATIYWCSDENEENNHLAVRVGYGNDIIHFGDSIVDESEIIID